uniref:Uncharacterized protein n=1 Tax=Odontella aurita TaxID=265563 RepID=A0A6U6FJK1_9STRA|mmetsp:Transcript_353/g.1039  ORF Transcript_353/g.1039 Transcript_353/m.1039 type:complete len:434 (+) Transcript_353:542-1843(+)
MDYSSTSPSLLGMNFASTSEQEEELFQIHHAANAFVSLTPLPVVRQPSIPQAQNPFQLKLAASHNSNIDILAAEALKTYRKSRENGSNPLLKSSASASSLQTSFGGSHKRKSAVKRRSGGALTLARRNGPSRGMDAAATKTPIMALGKTSITPPGSMSKLTRSLSGGKHRYSDSHLSAGLHGRKGSVLQIAGDKNASWGHYSSSGVSYSSASKATFSSAASTSATAKKTATSPLQFLRSMLEVRGRDSTVRPTLTAPPNFFLENTEERVSSYAHDVVTAVRTQDLPALCRLRSEGRTLQCCNRFGESLVHMACRRGFLDVIQCLLSSEGGDPVSLRVRDDYGRTPLHDACWVPQPNFELMDLLLDWCDGDSAGVRKEEGGSLAEQLLLMSDKRGHTPLDYVRREHWDKWNAFLEKRFGDKEHSLSKVTLSLEQ